MSHLPAYGVGNVNENGILLLGKCAEHRLGPIRHEHDHSYERYVFSIEELATARLR